MILMHHNVFYAVRCNPASSVRGSKHVYQEGKTPVFETSQLVYRALQLRPIGVRFDARRPHPHASLGRATFRN